MEAALGRRSGSHPQTKRPALTNSADRDVQPAPSRAPSRRGLVQRGAHETKRHFTQGQFFGEGTARPGSGNRRRHAPRIDRRARNRRSLSRHPSGIDALDPTDARNAAGRGIKLSRILPDPRGDRAAFGRTAGTRDCSRSRNQRSTILPRRRADSAPSGPNVGERAHGTWT